MKFLWVILDGMLESNSKVNSLMKKSVVQIKKMDCPSEIKMIESLFDSDTSINHIKFDLGARKVTFFHDNDLSNILKKLAEVGLPGEAISSEETSDENFESHNPSIEFKTLKILLLINFSMFLFEFVLGFISESTGLLADSIDMLADSLVYGISLYAVGRASIIKNKAAMFSGIFQIILAFGCLFEVIRRFLFGSDPISSFMIGVSTLALIANLACLFLIYKHKEGGVHMKASWIFSANDVLANCGVIFAGILVYVTNSRYPDLVVGGLIGIIVMRGAFQILKIARLDKRELSN